MNVLRLSMLLLLLSTAAMAQTNTGRISGRVTDVTRAVLPGVRVTITDEETNTTRVVVTDDNGNYTIANLRAGVYTVDAEKLGFRKSVTSGLVLTSDGRLTVDFKLDIGELSTAVEVVSAAGEMTNRTSGEIARVVDGEQVQHLALNTRNFTELFTLIPGAVQTTDDPLQLASGSGSGQAAINGNRGNSTNLTLDGAYNLGPTNNAILLTNIGIDYIREVKIQTSNFSAEYGRHSGAAVNVTTKGGTNTLHGTVFEFLRNDKTDAKPSLAPDKTPLRYNNFGYSVGGPIVKRKLFFFGGQEWKVIHRSLSATRRTLPTTAELNGDFRARLNPSNGRLKDPASTLPCTASDQRGCFADNVIPAGRMTADGRAIASAYRTAAMLAALYIDQPVPNNATFQPPIPFDFRQELVRLDYRFNDRHQLFGRYAHDINDYATPYGPASESQLPITPVTRVRPTANYLLQHTWIIGSSATNEALATLGVADQRSFPVGEMWKRDTHGFVFPQIFTGQPYDNGIPDVAVSGFASFRGPSFSLVQPTTEIGVQDNLTFIRKSHLMKFGVSLMRSSLDQNGRPRYTGNLTFNASGNTINSTGNSLADALLGNYRTYSETAIDPLGRFRSAQVDFYAMDTWKVTSRLSLELGLRFQNSWPYAAADNNVANFDRRRYDPAQAVTVTRTGVIDTTRGGNKYNGLVRAGDYAAAASDPIIASVPAIGLRGFYPPSHDAAPRVSFAYAPFENRKTVIRGGFGTFFDTPLGDMPASMLNTPPFNTSVNYEYGNLADPSSGRPAATTPFDAITTVDPDLRRPYTMNFSLSLQRELGRGLFFEAAYVGSQGRRLLRAPNINIIPLDVAYANFLLPASERSVDNALRPYKGYSAITQYLSDANSNYNALQLYLTKRAGLLRMTASYTVSRALTDASSHNESLEDPFDRTFNYGPATFHRPHIFVGTYTYSLPLFRHAGGVTQAVLGGYEISGVTRAQAGQRVTITGGAQTGGTRRADYLGGDVLAPAGERTPDNWINRTAFAIAPPNRRGTAGVGTVPTPALYKWDFSLRKRLAAGKGVALRFQADVFNAFNRPNYTSLQTSLTAIDFGRLASTGQPRQIQFGLKVEF